MLHLFARYLYIHAISFLSSFILLSIILFPIYAIDGIKGETYEKICLDILTFGNISLSNSSRYTAPLVLVLCIYYCISLDFIFEMKNFVEKRQALLRSPLHINLIPVIHPTILITTIPKAYMSRDVLLRILNQFPGGVKQIWLNRNLDDLPDKVDERTKFVDKLEAVECKIIKKCIETTKKAQFKSGSGRK